MADNDNRYKLWQTISKEYDLPDYNQFSKDMEDATKRKSLHDAVSAEYDLPDFDQFSKDMGYETQTSQQGNQNAQNAKKPQQTVQSSHVEEGRGLSSDNGYSKQKTAFDKAAEQAWNKLAHKGGIKWTIEGHPEVKMAAVTDDLVKRFPQLEQSRGYQVPFNMSTGTPIMQNIDDKGNIITPDEASEQYTKILTNQDFDYVPKQETAAVQIGSVVNTALSTKGGWLDRMARKSMAQYGDDWEQQKFESDGKEVSSSDVFGKVKQTIYDYYNSVLKGIRTHLMFNSDEEKQAYVDNLYKTGQLKEEDIPKANVLHYVQNVDKEEQIEAVRQAKLNRQLELKMAQERFNQLPQRKKGESDFDYNERILHEGALYEQDIRKLKKQIAQLDAVSDELQGNNTSWKEWGHAFKTSGIGSYHAWDLGATDLKDAIELNEVANDMNGGKQMTSSDYMAMRVMSQANEADAIENAVMPVSYKSKKGGFISAPFSFGFFVGGDIAEGLTSAVNKVAGKVISKAVKGAVLKAGGKKALSAATNLAEKAANTKCIKLFGMLAKDVEKAAFMENTTGTATTGAEILNRHIGTVTESDDGFKMDGESLPTAIIKGEISQNIESQTEFLGEHFPSSLKFIRGMAHTKVGSAMGLRNLAAWLTKVSRTEFATTLKSYATRAGINGVFGEYLEEVAGTAENALLVGDQKFSDLLDVKQQEEVAGSVVLSCLGMGIFGTAIYTGQRGLNMPTYYRLKHLQNKWDNAGLDLFTGEEWAKLKDRIDNTPNEGMKSVMADILKADNMTEEQARAAFNYARCSLTLRGMNIGAMKAAQLGLTDDRHIEQDNAYVEGRQAKDEDKHDIQLEFEDRSHELAEKLGISEQQLDNMSDEDLESLAGKDDQLDNLIYDYQTSHAKYQGVVDNADDEIDKAAQEAARQTDMATDKSRGTVRNATIKATKGEEDYGVYIVSGNVATNEDGSINVSESDDMILYYDPKSGKIEHCDAMRLSSLGEEVNAEETRNQAIADAKDKAIRKQAGIIDGTVGEGTSFTITDQEGNEHTYEVLADNGDGSAMITMDGNVQDTPVSLQDLQNLKDAEEAKRLEAAKMQRQQYEEEREKQNAPVEDNLNYADIINTNGNVEIAEVVDEEGNAMFPDAEEVFFVQNQGSRAKVMVLDSEGNLQPKLVKKSSVRTLGTMSVDEYRQERQKALKETENASEPSLVDETEPSNNVVPTDNVVTDNTTTDETQPGNEAEVTTSNETQNISNEQENTPKITLEDGTEVPMLEDGNPDFSQLTAGQVAELYDSQFGDDAEQIVSGNVNKAKKALDKANGMTVSGGSFAEQKASKEAKDKAIAEAKEKYDSAKAIADAYNERMLAKEEDTPEGRQNLIEKARRKFNRMKGSVKDNAQAIVRLYDETVGALLHRLYDSTGIDVFDDTANTVDEYVASSIAPYSLNYEGTETSKGVKQETGLSRSDFAKTGLLAKEGKGKTIGQLANDLWRDRPANFENITDQDVRNAIIDLITSGQTAFGLKNHIQNLRIAEAENILEQQKRQADELAHAEKQKEEELASTEQADDNTEDSSNVEATPADAQEEDKLADMPFEAPSPDEDVPFSAKDKAKDPLEVWNNMTDEEKAAYIENNRVKDTRLVDDVVGKKLRKAIEKIAGMMGATVQWQRTDMIRNGWFNPNTKTIYLALDSSILEGVQFVFGHEMTHEIKSKSPVMYDELKGLVKEKYGEELFEAITNDNEKRYAGVGKTDNDISYYEEETVADAIGDMINDLNLTHSIALKMSHPLLAKMHDVLLKIKNAFTGTPYSDNVKGIIRTIEMAYVKTANREAVNTATQEGEGGQRLSLREKPAPKNTQKVYKLMRLGEDGKLYPLFIGSGAEVELGKWYDAESPKLQDLTSLSSNDYVGTRTITINGVDVKEKYNYGAYIVNNETGEAMSLADFKAKYSKEFAKMGKNPNKKAVNWATDNGYRWIKIEEKKQGQSRYGGEARSYYNYGINGSGGVTTFAMRPGWHAGSLPTMRQIGKGSGRNLRDDTFVWVEGEIPADIDYNEEAQKNADKDIPDHIPTDGYYLKATNANKEASQADRVGWYVAGAFKANRIMSDKETRNIIDEWNAAHPDEEKVEYDWKRESGKDFNAETMSLDDAPKFSLKVYHGSGADFTEFDFDHMGEGAGSQSFGWGGVNGIEKKKGSFNFDFEKPKTQLEKDLEAIKTNDWNLPEEVRKKVEEKLEKYLVSKSGEVQQDIDVSPYFEKDNQTTAKNVLKYIIENSTDREIKNMAQYVLNNLGKNTDVPVKFFQNGKRKHSSKGTYYASTHSIEIDAKSLTGSNTKEALNRMEGTIIHEIAHAITSRAIDSDPAARKEILEIFSEFTKLRSQYGITLGYASKNPKEFVAEFLGNKAFREALMELPSSTKKVTLGQKILNFIKKILGIPVKNTFFNRTDDAILRLMDYANAREWDNTQSEDEEYSAGTIYGGAEEGDVNYVIFKPEDMQIVEHEKFSVKEGINRGYTQRENGDGEKFFLRLQDAINETDTEPTEAQKKSGNYKKGHVKFGGYDYTIENPKGSYRSGVDENGKEWKQKMNDTYGYIRGKFGKDGDHLDMFINDKADLDSWNGDVFVIDQVNQDGTFDEHKVMYGYGSLDDAKKAYLSNYEKGWTGLGNITPVSKAGFDKWLDKSNRKLKPFADYADITSKTNMDTAPSSFEEFLDVVRYSIRNEKERAAAEDAYNFAQENRPDRYSRYAIVNMEKPGAVPQYLEKKAVADNWRRYYNKLKWGNYKLFDLDKPFEDNVKNLVGKFSETFRKKNDTTLSKINELTSDYNKRKEEYDAMSNSIQELLNGLMKQGRSLAEAESVIRDWGLYKEMDSKYQNLMGIRKQLNELRSGKVADRVMKDLLDGVDPRKIGEAKDGGAQINEAINNSSDNIRFSLKEEKEKIVADAKANGTYMTAPNGEKTKLNAEQWVTVRTTNFKNWFGDWENDPDNASKVVDENGEPLVMYHYTDENFTIFGKDKEVGKNTFGNATNASYAATTTIGHWFTSNKNQPEYMGKPMACFLNIKEPFDGYTLEGLADYLNNYISDEDFNSYEEDYENVAPIIEAGNNFREEKINDGYDGVVIDDEEFGGTSYVAFNANQIKSADNNNGDFSTENDDIRYSLRVDRYRDELNQWKKDNNLPKDAERPQLPVREPNESAADFLKRVKEYRKQAALWATAPTYEDHLLTSDTAQGQFNLEMQRKAVLTRIVIQDSMLAIRKAQEAIMKEKGVDKLNPAEDAYTAENRSHGKAKNEFEEYNDEFLQPLRKAYNELMQRLGKSYDNVKVYMIAKHGLERNAYIAFKYALDEDYETNEERMNAYNNYKADMDRLNNDADFEAGRIDFAAWKQRDGFIRTKYAPSYFKFRFDENGMTKDYSGLSALFDADDYEGAAADLVKEVEDANPYYTDELWYATNDATKKILRDSYNAGMMTEDNFNFVNGMYRNYIPLRGWGDTNADQVWNYVGGGKGAFNQVVKEAKGRKSLADDPIAYIENMAESAILMNNRNWVKQHLLLLAQNHRTSLLNVSKAWYIKTKDAQGNEEWIPASPQITEGMTGKQVEAALEAFEQKMEQMQQNGEATQKREHLEISYPQTNGEEREHEVRVMKGGEEYVIYVNGDPQLAQAVNNTRARKVREGIEESRPQRFLARTGRYMAAAYTSMSPLFIPSNYMRDLTMTLASTAIREDARYNYLLRRNMLRHWNTFPMVLSYQNGTLREKVRNGSASRVEQMFYDFMMNGGETGFVTSVDVEDLKKKFKNDLKDLNRMAANPKKVGHIIMNSIETLNRAIEDSNRFMVYMTSIEYGRSIEEAVNNAKDVTLNFNRKGTGEHGWQAVRDMYLFINPAVQSLQTLGALAKHYPFKFTAVTTGWLATGLLVPMLNNLLMSFFGGDDDKDKYWQFTKWDRRNNFIMWIPFTKEFVKIPLAQEFRGFYGVGDMIASKLWGGEKAEESWGDYALDLAGQIVDMLPLDPTGYDGNIGLALTPNAARPIGELALNVDFTGKPIFKNSEYNKYDPNFTKAYVGTPDWLVRISKMVNSIDNKYPDVEQNAIDRFGDPKFNLNNPAVIDHLLSSYLGGSYTMGSQIIGVATKALNGDDIKMADIPLASKFVSNPDDRPVSKKQGEEFWDIKERHDRAANTLSKLKKKAKVDGDYSALDIFFGSDEYRQYKEDDKKVKKYEEDRKKEKAQETGEAYRPHKTTADDVYKSHTTPKDDFEDMKMKQLYEKLNSYKIRYEAIDGISSEKGDAYYKANKAAIDAIEEIAYDKSQIASIKKGFLSDGQNTYDADGMKDIRELRKRILDVLEKANKAMMNNRK